MNPRNCECECNKSCDFSEYLDSENCKCKKRLIDKLVDECDENIDGVKLTKITIAENNYKCNSCTVYIVLFSILFIIMLEMVLILLTINTWIVIKEMFLNIMIMFIIHNITLTIDKLILKIELIIFTMTWLNLKILMQSSWELTKNDTKTLVFTTLGISKIEWIPCI